MKKVLAYGVIAGLAIGGASLGALQAPAPQGGPAGAGQGQGGGGGRGGGGAAGRGGGQPQGPTGPPLVAAAPYKAGIPEKAPVDTVITNVRIVVGTGQVIDNGHITVRGGKIAEVAAGAPSSTQGLRVLNAQGLTALPGFIDGHKHLNDGYQAEAQGRSLLEAGYTTILVSGAAQGTASLSDKVNKMEINGPRIIPSGAVNLRQTPAEARAQVQMLAAMGIKHTAEIGLTPEPAPPQAEVETLRAIVEEAKKVGMQVNIHAVSTPAMMAAVDVGITRQVHLPNKDFTSFDDAEKIAKSGTIVAGLIAFGAPIIDRDSPPPAGCPQPCAGSVIFPRDNTPRFRTGMPWPDSIAGPNRDAKGRALGTELAYEIYNARRIWEADPMHGDISWSTDQNYADTVVLEHELKSFNIVFSMADIARIMGPNSARFVGMENEIGTLEVGKRADIILQSGDPTYNIYGLLSNKLTMKDGRIVIDKR